MRDPPLAGTVGPRSATLSLLVRTGRLREDRRSFGRLQRIEVDRGAQSVHNMRPSAALALTSWDDMEAVEKT